ncbi:ribonuclease Z [Marinimicrococcus flavescens]|uniref:MBL fold metallo-hydrolase n=1 Tax=Marinimicrococcus flavescens TaxID=3031815 RepID=A0AAP3XQQ7_9PROT|nr:MBL fold metallo-hydrolase [Marinimicrococcus flavescens]
MPGKLQSRLINPPFGDPGLHVELGAARRAFLFDMGSLAPLGVRQLLRVEAVFVSHMHMDHFSGFDWALRLWLGRPKRVRLFGPIGFIDAVEHRLLSYSWNLAHGYEAALVLEVAELDEAGYGRCACFGLRDRFRRQREQAARFPGGVLIDEPDLEVRCATLDHGIPCLAFALEERRKISVRKSRLLELGLETGPWLGELKRLVLAGAAATTTLEVQGRDGPRRMALDVLSRELLTIGRGASLAYVTDCGWSEENRRRIHALARDVDSLFIEAAFLEQDRGRARDRRHLTARQAGILAREAGARRVVPFHFSPRYEDREALLRAEAEAAFRGDSTAAP